MAALEEHALSVQSEVMAVEGMHVVAIVQADEADGLQQPSTPKYVFVAQVCWELEQLTGDAERVSTEH